MGKHVLAMWFGLGILATHGVAYADGSGTGFVLSKAGLIATAYHVVEGATAIQVVTSDGRRFLAVVASEDTRNDLAILRIQDAGFTGSFQAESPLVFASVSTRMGQECFTMGFPLGEIMGTTARLSTGVVDSLRGLQDDPRLVQISNPVQPGNSGGPLFGPTGDLIGVVVSGLNAKYFYEQASIIPENVNFAIKSVYLRALVETLGEDSILSRPNSLKTLTREKQVELVTPFVVRILVKTAAQSHLQTPAPSNTPPPALPGGSGFVPPIRGEARVEFMRPVTKREKNEVVTRIVVRNISNAPIARLTVSETWYGKDGSMVGGSRGFVNGLLQPGEVTTIEIRTPYDPKMNSNNWNFSHANGGVRVILIK